MLLGVCQLEVWVVEEFLVCRWTDTAIAVGTERHATSFFSMSER